MKLKFYKNFPEGVSYSLAAAHKPTCILFAEGDAEAFFLEKWLTLLGRNPNDIAVLCYRGGTKLPLLFKNISIEPNFSNVQRFGFFLDAEAGHAGSKATMVSQLLINQNVIPAGTAVVPGALLNVGGKLIALCVSPDNSGPGFIEDSVMHEIANKPLAPCISDFGNCVGQVTGAGVSSKTLVQAYLGAIDSRLCGTGRGFISGILDVMDNAYLGVRNTLTPVL